MAKFSKNKVFSRHGGFIGALALFVGFSTYAIVSFFNSNGDFIENFYADVTSGGEMVVVARENPFWDLGESHRNEDAVVALFYAGILDGYGDGTFRPDKPVNRAEFAKILAEAAALDYTAFDSAALAGCFRDVGDLPDHWFAPAVCAAKQLAWVSGYADGSFSPAQSINRAEALKIVLKAFEFEIPVISEPDAAWYDGVVQAGQENGIVGRGTFNAGEFITRGEVAQMIYNAMSKRELL